MKHTFLKSLMGKGVLLSSAPLRVRVKRFLLALSVDIFA